MLFEKEREYLKGITRRAFKFFPYPLKSTQNPYSEASNWSDEPESQMYFVHLTRTYIKLCNYFNFVYYILGIYLIPPSKYNIFISLSIISTGLLKWKRSANTHGVSSMTLHTLAMVLRQSVVFSIGKFLFCKSVQRTKEWWTAIT